MNRILNVHMGGGGGGGISFTSIQTLNKTDYFGPAFILGRIYFMRKDWINIILLQSCITFSMFTDEEMQKNLD